MRFYTRLISIHIDIDICAKFSVLLPCLVSLLPSKGHLFMASVNGGEMEIDHVSPPKGKLLYRSSNPTIFLKIHSEAELFLPIIVDVVFSFIESSKFS